jgi:acyl-CoA synthetase (AMP-forming)/AMP-acid ligase II
VLVDEQLAAKVGLLRAELSKHNVGAVYCWSSVDHLSAAARAGVKAIDTSSVRQADKDAIHNGVGGGLEGLNQFSDGCIFFTSGTTGYPKAVISTQRAGTHNVVSAVISPARMFLRMGLSVAEMGAMMSAPAPQSVSLLSIPLFHVTGNLASLLGAIGKGGKLVFQRKWSVKDAVKLIVQEKVTTIGGVPAIATAILQSPDLPKDYQFAAVSYGGAPPPERLARDLKGRFPAAFIGQGWGMTETNAVVCHLSGPDYVIKPTSVGAPIPICDIKIVDPETRRELPRGSFGLLLSRGEGNMREYLNNPKATAETIDADGYVDTGDMGHIDEEGFLHLGDRMKDIIIRGGENIASAEVENALALDDRLAEVAAVSVPDDVLGERVGAIVSLAPGAKATEAEVLAAVIPRLRYPARPVIVVVHPEPLPRNANGKIVKTDCRKIVRDIFATRPKIQDPPRAKL